MRRVARESKGTARETGGRIGSTEEIDGGRSRGRGGVHCEQLPAALAISTISHTRPVHRKTAGANVDARTKGGCCSRGDVNRVVPRVAE